jgi:hypothetical protein
MLKNKDGFMDWVQLHERSWGSRSYPARPSLEQILAAPVVTFWQAAKEAKHPSYTIRLYEDLQDVEKYLTRLLLRSSIEPPKERLVRIYAHRKRMTIRAVRVLFGEAE